MVESMTDFIPTKYDNKFGIIDNDWGSESKYIFFFVSVFGSFLFFFFVRLSIGVFNNILIGCEPLNFIFPHLRKLFVI